MSDEALHVAVVSLDDDPAHAARWLPLLSEEERARLASVVSPVERARRACARGHLRRVLGAALGVPAEDVPLTVGSRGKPVLADSALFFNVSHSGGLAVIVLAPRPVGVDVEPTVRGNALSVVAAWRLATAAERRALRRLGPDVLAGELLRFWTRKEALGKALGTGLDDDLCALEVWRPGWTETTVHALGRRWTVGDLAVAEGFVASVCCAGELPSVAWLRTTDELAGAMA